MSRSRSGAAGRTQPGRPAGSPVQPCGYLRSTRNTAWVSLRGAGSPPRGPSWCACRVLAPAPLALCGLRVPLPGWQRAAGSCFGEAASGRGASAGVSPPTRPRWLRLPGGTGLRAAGRPPAAGSACGVGEATRRECQVGGEGWTAFRFVLPPPSSPPRLWAGTASQIGERERRGPRRPPRGLPLTEGRREPPLWLRSTSREPGDSRSRAGAFSSCPSFLLLHLLLPLPLDPGVPGLCPRGGGAGTVNMSAARPLLSGGERVFGRCFHFSGGASAVGAATAGGRAAGERCWGPGSRSLALGGARLALAGRADPDPGGRWARSRVARAALREGEQQRTSVLTDGRGAPCLSLLHGGPRAVPVLWLDFGGVAPRQLLSAGL